MKKIISVVLSMLLLSACAKNTPIWQEQYELGVRYLSEGNYEEAIIAFTAIIEIDPKQAPAYVSLADAYLGIEDFYQAYETILAAQKGCGYLDEFAPIMDRLSDYMPFFIVDPAFTSMLQGGLLTHKDIPAQDVPFKNISMGDSMETVFEKMGFGSGISVPCMIITVNENVSESYVEVGNVPMYLPGGTPIGEEPSPIPTIEIEFVNELGEDLFYLQMDFEAGSHITEMYCHDYLSDTSWYPIIEESESNWTE